MKNQNGRFNRRFEETTESSLSRAITADEARLLRAQEEEWEEGRFDYPFAGIIAFEILAFVALMVSWWIYY